MIVPKITFVFDRRHTASRIKEGSVDLRVTCNGKTKILTTGIQVLPSQWNLREQCVKMRPDAVMLNRVLMNIRLSCVDLITKMHENEGVIDMSRLNTLMNPKADDETFIEYVERRIGERAVSDGTRQRYRTFLAMLKRWGGVRNFSDITASKVRSFDEYLRRYTMKDGSHYLQSNIHEYHKAFKIFINDAVTDERISENPYTAKRIHIDRGETAQIPCLTEEQVERLASLQLRGHLAQARDMFLFQCYTGLAYSDMQKFNLRNCETEPDGSIRVRGRRTKTNTEYIFYLLPQAVEIAESYGGRLPKISNQKYNDYLKPVGSLIGEERLHSHMGRSTFASTMLNHGVSTDILKHTLGHTTTIQTNRYATMREQTIKDAFMRFQHK